MRLIAGMAEAYYVPIAPHNPLGPISLAAGIQLAASIPNFLCQEQVSLGEGYLKTPFQVEKRLHPDPDRSGAWASNWTRTPWPTRSTTTGETPRPTTATTAPWWTGKVWRATANAVRRSQSRSGRSSNLRRCAHGERIPRTASLPAKSSAVPIKGQNSLPANGFRRLRQFRNRMGIQVYDAKTAKR